ncbi:MAG: C25 family cysteine peptidase [Acidobacteriota bacterium]
MRQITNHRKGLMSATGLAGVFLVLGLLAFPESARTGAAVCPFVVDPGGMGTHTTIQAAVDDLPNPGPCTITVKAGAYSENVAIASKNTLAASDAERIVIIADPTAPPGSVIVDPPGNHAFTLSNSKFITIKAFNLTGSTQEALLLSGGGSTNQDVTVDSNNIHNNGSASANGGVGIGEGNIRTNVVNNLISNNGRNGIVLGAGGSTSAAKPKYIVNNTILENGFNGITTPSQEEVYLVNNLIVANGTASGTTGGRQGVNTTNAANAATKFLVNNMFYNNTGGDIDVAGTLDGGGGDSGNRTTTGAEGVGVIGCTFADCATTHTLSEIFVNPAVNDFHLKTLPPLSPATDKGTNSFVSGQERVPAVDFEGDLRPKDGDNDTVATTDIGYDEAGPPTAAKLCAFTARRYSNGQILLEWRTGYEIDNLGFNVYREQGGKPIRITPQLIAGSALLAGPGTTLTAGRSYSWNDVPPRANKEIRYLLEAVDLNGQGAWHGPITVDESSAQNTLRAFDRAKLLSTLGAPDASERRISTMPVERRAFMPLSSSIGLHPQASKADHPALKLSLKQEGWYRVTQPELVAAGLDPTIDPRLLQLLVDGQEQPLMVIGEGDGKFDPSDRIEFYGIGLDSAVTDSRTYWLATGSQQGLRVQTTKRKGHKSAAASFLYTVERRDRTVYFSALKNGEKENFFGAVIAKKPVDQNLVLQNLDAVATGEATLEVELQGVTGVSHRVSVRLNGVDLGDISFIGQAQGSGRFSLKQTALREGENQLSLTPVGPEGDVSILDYVRLTYWHTYKAENNALRFTAKSKQQVTIDGFTSAAIRVIDVSDPDAVREVPAVVNAQAGGFAVTVQVPKSGSRTLLAFADSQIKRPVAISIDRPSTLRDKQREADLIIVTRRELVDSVEPLRALRQSQGLRVEVADLEDVYDEFSYGQKTPQAVKDFLAYANTSWKVRPRYALIVGDASLDPKNYLGVGDFDLVPTKLIDTQLMETASDDWFVDFNRDGLPEMAIGRLPARTTQEATMMISRIISYEGSAGSNSVLLASDRNEGFDFEAVSARLRALLPPGIHADEVRRGDMDDAAAKSQLLASINRGQRIVNYVGHGSVDLWSGNLLTSSDMGSLTNSNNPSLFVMMTCLNGYFQDPALDGLAESLMKAEGGGAVAVWASSGLTKPDQQVLLNRQFVSLLLGESSAASPLTLGDAAVKAKAFVSDVDVRRTWILFGDPVTKLK